MKKTITLLACSTFGLLATAQAAPDHWRDPQAPDPTPPPDTQTTQTPPQTSQTPVPDPTPVTTPPTVVIVNPPPPPPPATMYYSEDEAEPGAFTYAWTEPRLVTGIGVGLAIGGGIMGFTDR